MNRIEDKNHRVELVITAPREYGSGLAYISGARQTIGVLTQLVARANDHVTLAFPFVRIGEPPTKVFIDAVQGALRRSVRFSFFGTESGIVEFQKRIEDPGGKVSQIEYFRPRANFASGGGMLGSHAKVLIADGEAVYLGSANLTHTGLGGNLELGVLLEGKVAQQVDEFWEYLVHIGFFTAY